MSDETNSGKEVLIGGRWQLRLPKWRQDFYASHPDWEIEYIQALYTTVKQGMTVVDVGAECGDYSALCQKWVGRNGHTILVEPVDKMWPLIYQMYQLNDLPVPMKSFVGFASDKQVFGIPEKVNYHNPEVIQNEWPPIISDPAIPDPGFQHLCENDAIPQQTLDAIIGDSHVDVITMDIEGAEVEALRGAASVISRDLPTVFVAIHPAQLERDYGRLVNDVYGLMLSYGYQHKILSEDHEIHVMFTPIRPPEKTER